MKRIPIHDHFFLEIARPILEHSEFQKLKGIRHHHGSVYEHCLKVSYLAYRIAIKFRLDVVSTIRGALLHDFYLYKFKKRENKNILAEGYRHSRNHPKIAKENALKYFQLNEKEIDIILSHMFPVGLPKTPEAWVTTWADKFLAIAEYSVRALSFASRLNPAKRRRTIKL